MGKTLNRREFLLGMGASGLAVAGAGALAGCAPKSQEQAGAAADGAAQQATANEATAPIEPVGVPASWDKETDIVVVGSGGGGLNAAVRARELGLSVVVVDKLPKPGGNSRSATMFTIGGGTPQQNEAQLATPSYPYEVDKWVDHMMMGMGQGANPEMLHLIGENLSKCFAWMTETYDLAWTMGPHGDFFATAPVGMDKIIDAAYARGQEQGAEYLLGTKAQALVMDGDRVVGVKVEGEGGKEMYLHGTKAVLLTGGGFAANRDLLAEYCPSALKRAASCYLANETDMGDCFRMGQGAGADVVNRNSYTMFDGGMDWLETGNGGWCHYLYDGATQLVRQPWLNIRKDGTRNRYIDSSVLGALTDQATVECGGPDGRSYVIFDKNWDEYMQAFGQKACREPIQDGVARQPLIPEHYQDYHAGVQEAIDAGMICECDTLDELAEALGLDPDVLAASVEKWNAMVAAGHDDAPYPYPDAWLHPIDTPPYYGAKIGGNLFMTQTGLLVNTKLQVVNTDGKVIPGLYAGWHTAGGAAAPDAITSMAFDTGGVSKSYLGGYLAAAFIAEEE